MAEVPWWIDEQKISKKQAGNYFETRIFMNLLKEKACSVFSLETLDAYSGGLSIIG